MSVDPRQASLHTANPLGRFSDRAADYVKYRPDYPEAAFDAMLEGMGSPDALIAVDVGAGTGISARQLAARGVRVIAVEPNAEMRAAAEPHPRVEWVDGQAERTGLPDACVDLVISAQAFHWFRADEALAEFRRVLRPGGRLALMWNSRDATDPLTRGYREAIRDTGGEDPADRRAFDPGIIERRGLFARMRALEFPHAQTLDGPGLLGRATSASYVAKTGPAFEALRAILAALHERHRDASGRVALRYRTKLFLAARA